ncbi:IS4 family transposase [Ruegeria sp. HKCCD8929]|uniref:IS4 family transposase n=1 Tax=Ruegeria sp. HKCCD8929 TaxID=2683006 RepID=UPI0014895831|nr:IS4 family transposase [Ruegeria sp. HKCCD8929]
MTGLLLAPLIATLRPHFDLGKTRLETLAVLLVGLANGRTVNLSHLASQFPGGALHTSNYRRLQRFFQFVRLDVDTSARLIVRILKLGQPRLLALDRTQWALGSSQVNILVLAIVTRRFRVPLMWTLLDHRGCSNTEQRIALMEKYVHLFGVSSIKALLADREFIGTDWIEFLNKNNIPFVIRLKENMRFQLEDGSVRDFPTLLRKRRRGTWAGWLSGMKTISERKLRFAAKRIRSGELLIVATNLDDGSRGLNLYRQRWGVECLFADAKTRGFNIEDTHITDPEKLGTLLVVIALAVTWAYRCATRVMGRKGIRRKVHGRREKSWFRTGFDALRNWIMHKPEKAVAAWTHRYPGKPLQTE